MDFVGKSKISFGISLGLIVLSIILLITPGLNWGVDFTGGTLMERGFERPITAGEIREVLGAVQLADIDLVKSVIQPVENNRAALIRTQTLTSEQIQVIDDSLSKHFGEVQARRTEMVGPVVGQELVKQALMALLLAAIGMLIYLSFRFEYRFATVAVLAVLHDALIVLGIFALLAKEINSPFIASILTVVGYSVNNTIVIFDKIRENMSFRKRESWAELANKSINETLTRSINTSLTTLLAVLALFFFGGATIQDFVLALLLGIVVGTYSSVFVAGPLWVVWKDWDDRRKATKTARA
ncbi:MAG: protein translocase subunit SecF [Firmicutes bacterium]|nr:protein translocase subunit SecF [Bacillota bacterium]